jgi:ribA/ribD-fused uncharacterized protein
MADRIDRFDGENAFLSNFFQHELEFEGRRWPSSEHAFQACKTTDPAEQERIRAARSPGSAKALGKKVRLRRDWDSERVASMEAVLRAKFADPQLRARLLGTGDAELVEGNSWNDTFWGVCRGRGQNWLGKLLMKIRGESP